MRDATNGGAGFSHMQFTISEIANGFAYGIDNFKRDVQVPVGISPGGKGFPPSPGEKWLIEKSTGIWTLLAILSHPDRSVAAAVMSTAATVVQNTTGLDSTLSLRLTSVGGHTSPLQLSFDQGNSYQTVGEVNISAAGTANIMVPVPTNTWFQLASPGDIVVTASYFY